MSRSDYELYLAMMAIMIAITAGVDLWCSDQLKDKAMRTIGWVVTLPNRVFSIRFYTAIVGMSLLMTAWAIFNVGGIQSLAARDPHFQVTLKSTAPLLLGLLLKVTMWDYFMAIKSADILRSITRGAFRWPARLAFIALDVVVTLFFTAVFLKWIESVQDMKIVQESGIAKAIVPTLSGFFDEFNLFSKYAVQVSLYWLNGAVAFWILVVLSRIANPEHEVADAAKSRMFPFTMISTVLAALCFVVLSCAYFADKH